MKKISLTRKNTNIGHLILVTPQFPLAHFPNPEYMIPAIEDQPEIRIDTKAARALQFLLRQIRSGNQIAAVSGFRTQAEQEKIWNDTLKEQGLAFTQKFVAVPGHSEHQTGLAIDLGENKEAIDFICPDFPNQGICRKFRQSAPVFGFIERYPLGKEMVTGIGAEPWHFRYVGFPHSMIMTEQNRTLEEYISFLKVNTDLENPYMYDTGTKVIAISYIPVVDEERIEMPLPDRTPYQFSGTNEGGMVLSMNWKAKQRLWVKESEEDWNVQNGSGLDRTGFGQS